MMNPSKSRNILRKKIKAVKNEVDRLNGIMIGIQQNIQWHFENQLPHPNHLDDEYNECRVNEVKLLKHLKTLQEEYESLCPVTIPTKYIKLP